MNNVSLSGQVSNIAVISTKKGNKLTKMLIDGVPCCYFKNEPILKEGMWIIAKGFLKVNTWQTKKYISDVIVNFIQIISQTTSGLSFPQSQPQEKENNDVEWFEELKNE